LVISFPAAVTSAVVLLQAGFAPFPCKSGSPRSRPGWQGVPPADEALSEAADIDKRTVDAYDRLLISQMGYPS
jgi:hypothetical protein